MDYIVIIIIVVVAAALIFGSYGRGKHEPKEVKPKGKEADENHKYIEVRATEDQLKDLIDEYAKQGWTFEDKQVKPNTSMFGSNIWQLSFHRLTPEEDAANAEQARADEARHNNVPVPQPIAAEPAPQVPDEDPFGMEPAQPAPDEDPFPDQAPVQTASDEDPFPDHVPVQTALDEDPFADIPLPQLPAPEADNPLQAEGTAVPEPEEQTAAEAEDTDTPADEKPADITQTDSTEPTEKE